MEVDPPNTSSSSPGQNGGSNLKRSNSAPMINMLVTAQTETEAETSNPQSSFKPANVVALRRLSSSNMMLQNMPAASTSPPIRGPDRVTRLKQEEIHIADREKRHEKETQSSLWITNNWDSLTLDCPEPMDSHHRRPRSFSESLHIMTQSNILCGSPSPTRGSIKQCFSPSMQIPVKNMTFTPSPSPSPTRKNFMRSLSPIAMRSGTLKRKLENDGGDRLDYLSPPKKFHTGPLTPDRLMTQPHPLAYSISSSSLEEASSSPDQIMSRCSGGGSTSSGHSSGSSSSSSSSSSSTSSLSIHPYPHHSLHHHHHGMRSPLHAAIGGQHSPLSSSGAPSPLSSSGHGSLSSGCSSSIIGGGGSSVSGGGGGLNTNNNNDNNSIGGLASPSSSSTSSLSSSSSSFPAVLTSKQGFLFRPVSISESAMGSQSLSSSSSLLSSNSTSLSSSSLSAMNHPLSHLHHHHHHPSPHHPLHHHPQQHHHQSPPSLSQHSSPSAVESSVVVVEGNNNNNVGGATSSDVCMVDSEMGEVVHNSSSSKSVTMEDQQVSYNFKPISPDHHG